MDLLRHLRYFVAVAEELHFGRAAQRLHMAQSPLSQRIRSLEQALGLELLVRTTRSVELTPAGRTLLDEARAVLERVERLEATMDAARGGTTATLMVGVSGELSGTVLATVVAQLADAHPDVRVQPVEQADVDQRRALIDRRIDLGFVRRPVPPTIEAGPPLVRELGVLVGAEDELAGLPSLDLGLLEDGRPTVLPPRERSPGYHDELLSTCYAYGFRPRRIRTAASAEFAAGLVLTEGAVALIEEPTPPLAGTAWRPLTGRPLVTSASAVWRAGERRPVVHDLARLLADVLVATGQWTRGPASAPSTPRPRPADAF